MPRLVAAQVSREDFNALKSQRNVGAIAAPALVKVQEHQSLKGLDKAGWVSRLLWLWVGDLVELANREPLKDEHLGSLPLSSTTAALLALFDKQWELQLGLPKPSIISAIFATFRPAVYDTGVREFCIKASQLATPVLVQALLKWYSTGEGSTESGLGYAFGLFGFAVFFQGFVQSHNFMTLFKTGMDLRTILCARIYEKALTVSAEDKAKLTTGEVVNLMSADAEKVVYLCIMFHGLWTTPLFLVAAIWLLVNLVGVAIVPGLAMLFVTAPIQGYVISQQHKLQRAVMHKSDARVKLVNEVLQGVRVVKYYNWEDSFEKRLADARAEEVKLIKKLARINAFNSALMMTVPMLMLIAMLITIFATGGDFSPTTVFVAVSLLVLLRFPLIMLPMTIGMCVMGRISLKRIERFLLLGDMPRFKAGNKVSAFTQLALPALTMALPRGTVKVEAGAFQWALGAATEQNKKKKAAVLIGAVVAESKADTSDEVAAAAAELVHDASESPDAADAAIGIEGETVAVATWRLTLPTFETAAGSLVAVTGRVGSGKSSLLAALLGELDPSAVSDEASPLAGGSSATAPAPPVLRGSVGYAAQQPWIMNATLRDNVLFGQDFNEHKYREVLECCCLGPDLAALPAGDMTEIGEKGINLSGGQKARVGLARVVYADPDVVLLDDVLAAVDAHVGKKLFDECVLGFLRAQGKTVFLVTNQLGLLDACDDVMVLVGGALVEHGSCDALRATGHAFAKLMDEYVPPQDAEEAAAAEAAGGAGPVGTLVAGGQAPAAAGTTAVPLNLGHKEADGELILDETKQAGNVGLKVYKAYFVDAVGGGYFNLVSLLVLSVGAQIGTLLFDFWLSVWSDAWSAADQKSEELSSSDHSLYMGTYVGLGAASIAVGLARYLNHARHSATAAQGLFAQLLHGVLHAPIEFFDVTPIGRILNRFSRDTDSNDTALPQNLMSLDLCLMTVVGTLCMCAAMMPPFIVVLVPVLTVYFKIMLRYVPVSRDLQRLESISRSPIFAQFSETLGGTATIRAFGRTAGFVKSNRNRLDQANRSFFTLHNANRWLQLRLEVLGAVILCSVALIVVWSREERDGGLTYGTGANVKLLGEAITVGVAGLVLTYTQQITGLMNWAIRQACDAESRMTCVERNGEYAALPSEQGDHVPPDRVITTNAADVARGTAAAVVQTAWPASGALSFVNVNLRYRAGLPLVLKDLSLEIGGGQRVGVCGRSGSGKSSLLVALFRLTNVEPTGRILIDGVDIASLSLAQLRRTVGIIPQDPVLFVGTLRGNLDAFGEHSDAALWAALQCAALDGPGMAEQHPGGLSAAVDEGGGNWSTGQRQLICLARAVLRAPRVLAIDEATANIDLETDAVVQKSIRSKFQGTTCLTIAHRLQTILDSDLIVTMDAGRVAEAGSPAELLADPKSLFSALVKNDKGAAAQVGTPKPSSENLAALA